MSSNGKKIIIIVLIAFLAGLGIYTYMNNKKHVEIEANLTEEKDNIVEELNKMEAQYNVEIAKNTELSDELTKERDEIIQFKDSLKKLKNTNWKNIKFYKRKIKNLTENNRRMFKINDSILKINKVLNAENQNLNNENTTLNDSLQQQTTYNTTLSEQNLELAKKVAIGSVVKANNFSVSTMRKRNNGSFKESDKARRVDLIKVSFTLADNPIAEEKSIVSRVTIKAPNGSIINPKGIFNDASGQEIRYTETTNIPYKKKTLNADFLISTESLTLEKGDYEILIYTDDKLVGRLTKTLK
jgi:hypothetical protein